MPYVIYNYVIEVLVATSIKVTLNEVFRREHNKLLHSCSTRSSRGLLVCKSQHWNSSNL